MTRSPRATFVAALVLLTLAAGGARAEDAPGEAWPLPSERDLEQLELTAAQREAIAPALHALAAARFVADVAEERARPEAELSERAARLERALREARAAVHEALTREQRARLHELRAERARPGLPEWVKAQLEALQRLELPRGFELDVEQEEAWLLVQLDAHRAVDVLWREVADRRLSGRDARRLGARLVERAREAWRDLLHEAQREALDMQAGGAPGAYGARAGAAEVAAIDAYERACGALDLEPAQLPWRSRDAQARLEAFDPERLTPAEALVQWSLARLRLAEHRRELLRDLDRFGGHQDGGRGTERVDAVDRVVERYHTRRAQLWAILDACEDYLAASCAPEQRSRLSELGLLPLAGPAPAGPR